MCGKIWLLAPPIFIEKFELIKKVQKKGDLNLRNCVIFLEIMKIFI